MDLITKIHFFRVKNIVYTVNVLNHSYGATKTPSSHDFDMSSWNLMKAYPINIDGGVNAGQMIETDGSDISTFRKEQNKNSTSDLLC
jgi:hypothetical protein